MQELGINVGMPVALYNGGIVVEYGTGNILYASYVPSKVVEDLLDVVNLEKSNIFVYVFFTCPLFVSNNEQSFIKEEVYAWGKYRKEQDVNGMHIQYMHEKKCHEKTISAVLIDDIYLSHQEKKMIEEVLQRYSKIKITDSGNGFIEIKGDGLNKGIIYTILKEHQKFTAKKILAIGDNDNDIELFNGADISVAVANSSALALDYADYICENKSAEGFYDMLHVLDDAKRYY